MQVCPQPLKTASCGGECRVDCCSPKRHSLKQLQAMASAGAEAGGEAVQGSPAGKAPAAAGKPASAGKAAAKVSHWPTGVTCAHFRSEHPMMATTVCMHHTWRAGPAHRVEHILPPGPSSLRFTSSCTVRLVCLSGNWCCSANYKSTVDSCHVTGVMQHLKSNICMSNASCHPN